MAWLIGLMVLVMTAFTAPAAALERHALVVGIDAYPNLATAEEPGKGQLRKARNDARAIAATLRRIGFSTTLIENPNRREMSDALGRLEQAIKPGDMVFFYFAGHGLEIESANWLVPGDFPAPIDGQGRALPLRSIKDSAFNAGDVVASLRAAGARTVIAVLDACREFVDAGNARSLGLRSGGLGQITAPEGVFVMTSAGARQLALDRLSDRDNDPNSVFTRVLLPLLEQPGLTIDAIARTARPRVEELARSVNHAQRPSYYDELSEPVVLVPTTGAPPPAPPVAPPPPPPPAVDDRARMEREAWTKLRDATDPRVIDQFLTGARDPEIRRLAEARLLELRKLAEATRMVPITPPPPPAVATYDRPTENGAIIDWCVTWATDCGQKGADLFCRSRGHGAAVSFQTFSPGRTWVVGDKRACQGTGCVGFAKVVCGPSSGRFAEARVEGTLVDWCATWASDCGQGGADLFCRRQGFGRATGWERRMVDRTLVLGSRQICAAAGACGALVNVVCAP